MAIAYTFPGWTVIALEAELAAVQGEIRSRKLGKIVSGSSSNQSWSIEKMPWEELWAYHNAVAQALGHDAAEPGPQMTLARPDFSGRGWCRW